MQSRSIFLYLSLHWTANFHLSIDHLAFLDKSKLLPLSTFCKLLAFMNAQISSLELDKTLPSSKRVWKSWISLMEVSSELSSSIDVANSSKWHCISLLSISWQVSHCLLRVESLNKQGVLQISAYLVGLPIIAKQTTRRKMAFHFDEYIATPLAMNWRNKFQVPREWKLCHLDFRLEETHSVPEAPNSCMSHSIKEPAENKVPPQFHISSCNQKRQYVRQL